MNFFYLDKDLHKAAIAHADGHVNKMISEYCQLLSTALRMSYSPVPTTVFIKSPKTGLMRKKKLHVVPGDVITKNGFLQSHELMLNTHENHPCNVWARESFNHFYMIGEVLNILYQERWIKDNRKNGHASYDRLILIIDKFDLNIIPAGENKPPPRCMPIHYWVASPVDSYRRFYADKLRSWLADPNKARYANYTNRNKPDWLEL